MQSLLYIKFRIIDHDRNIANLSQAQNNILPYLERKKMAFRSIEKRQLTRNLTVTREFDVLLSPSRTIFFSFLLGHCASDALAKRIYE